MFDSLFGTGKLEKMHINALLPRTSPNIPPDTSPLDTDKYEVQVNPESYNISVAVQYERANPAGSFGSEPMYNYTSPTTLDFTIIFDGTGVIPPASAGLDNVPMVGAIAGAIEGLFGDKKEYDVMDEIRKFMKVVCDISEEEHKPKNVRLTWGKQVYDGVLVNLALNYKLFKPNGTPLRAEARVTFQSTLFDITRVSEIKTASPDLTHVRTAIAGDTLPLMTHKIYGKPEYYIEVARKNSLFNFRKLNPGRSVFFPPTKKTAS